MYVYEPALTVGHNGDFYCTMTFDLVSYPEGHS